MTERTDLTDAQWSALSKSWELLCEHFDHVILAYDTECKDGTDHVFECNYHGGVSTGIGLAERAKHYWFRPGSNESEDSWKRE